MTEPLAFPIFKARGNMCRFHRNYTPPKRAKSTPQAEERTGGSLLSREKKLAYDARRQEEAHNGWQCNQHGKLHTQTWMKSFIFTNNVAEANVTEKRGNASGKHNGPKMPMTIKRFISTNTSRASNRHGGSDCMT